MTPTDAERAKPTPRTTIDELFFRPVDGAWLAAYRTLFGAAVCVSMLRFLVYGWVERLFVRPTFFFKYWGFEWVEPLSPAGMQALFVALAVAALCVAAGLFFRVAATFLALGLFYFQLLDVSTYLNHYYLVALLTSLLAVSPAGRWFSIDDWLKRRWLNGGNAASKTSPWVASGWLYVFRIQVGLVYTFAGIAKLQPDWLIHAQPLRIWLSANTEIPLIGPLFTIEGVPLLMSWAGFLFDSTIVIWLSLKKTRPFAYLAVIVFHVMTRVLFPIGMFPVFMTLSAMVFFEPDWPRRALGGLNTLLTRVGVTAGNWLRAASAAPAVLSGTALQDFGTSRLQRLGFSLLAVYCVVQLAMPLRFLVYGGNVLWHEQGMRYSWRVMVRAKGGSTVFRVFNPVTQQRWLVEPATYLNDMQESEMSSQPDLILQLAHHIRRDFEAKGRGPVEVRVDSRVALNGRRSAPFIDSTVDLTQISDGLRLAQYVLPAPQEPPAHTRPVR